MIFLNHIGCSIPQVCLGCSRNIHAETESQYRPTNCAHCCQRSGMCHETQSQPPLNCSVTSVFGQSLLHMEAGDNQGLFLRYMHRSNPKTTKDRQTENRNRSCKMYRVFIKKCIKYIS